MKAQREQQTNTLNVTEISNRINMYLAQFSDKKVECDHKLKESFADQLQKGMYHIRTPRLKKSRNQYANG